MRRRLLLNTPMKAGEPKFDLRTLPRQLRENRITQKEVEEYLKKLPDESHQSREIPLGEFFSSPRPQKPKTPPRKEPAFAPANETA